MKYLAAILFFCSAVFASEPPFFLPDEADDALYRLKRTIGASQSRLLVITPKIKSRTLEKALSKAAKKGLPITLVTSGKTDDAAAALVRFDSVDYRIVKGLQTDYRNGALALTLIRSDDRFQCVTSLPLTDEAFEHDIALLQCDSKLSSLEREHTDRIVQRSTPYLIP